MAMGPLFRGKTLKKYQVQGARIECHLNFTVFESLEMGTFFGKNDPYRKAFRASGGHVQIKFEYKCTSPAPGPGALHSE